MKLSSVIDLFKASLEKYGDAEVYLCYGEDDLELVNIDYFTCGGSSWYEIVTEGPGK